MCLIIKKWKKKENFNENSLNHDDFPCSRYQSYDDKHQIKSSQRTSNFLNSNNSNNSNLSQTKSVFEEHFEIRDS